MDAESNPILANYKNPTYIYSLHYKEFIVINAAAIQRQQAQIACLELRVKQLKKQFTIS